MKVATDRAPITPPRGASRLPGLAVGFCLAILVCFSSAVRIHACLTDENFDVQRPEGLLKSDPGLLFYFTERVIDAGGVMPEDFRADPRVEHPTPIDIPAEFTVGAEFLIAWTFRAARGLGLDVPLHVFCVWLMSFCASLAGLCAYGLTKELSGSRAAGLLAAFLWVLVPANYRTIGFILVREDLSLPLFALHLWLLALGARRGSTGAFVVSGIAAGLAAATWHAGSFLLAVEACAWFALLLASGKSPLGFRGAWTVPVGFAVVALMVPVLRTKHAVISVPMQIAGALFVASTLRDASRAVKTVAGIAALASLAWLPSLLGFGEDFRHVLSLMLAKLRHLGELPSDPANLAFETRLMWQGPFATLSPGRGVALFGPALLVAVFGLLHVARSAGRRESSADELALAVFTAMALPLAWLVQRLMILPGLLMPAFIAVWFLRRSYGHLALVLLLALQAATFLHWRANLTLSWYRPALRQGEIAAMVEALPSVVPEGEAVACDFMNSTAILAHTGRGIVLQPKWERVESRRRVEGFWRAFYAGTPQDLRQHLLDYGCRYLLVDRFTLWTLRASRYAAGLRHDSPAPHPGTAAALFLSQDEEVLRSQAGFRLLWRSPGSLVQSNGRPSDFFRLYELVD